MSDLETFKEKLESGKYDSTANANRALGQIDLGVRAKSQGRKAIAAYFTPAETSKTTKTPRRQTRKRRSSGEVVNGAGDSRAVTLFKLSQHPDAFALMAHLIAKAVDENTTLPELHEDVQNIAKLLQS